MASDTPNESDLSAAGGGFGPPGGPPPGGLPPGGYGPAGGGPPPGPGGFGPPPGAPGGGMAPAPGTKPITGGKESMAMHAMTIDPNTGLPMGEKPPASPAAVLALVSGLLLCLGPLTGITAIIAGILGLKAAKDDSRGVGGRGLSMAGIILGALNLVITLAAAVLFVVGQFL